LPRTPLRQDDKGVGGGGGTAERRALPRAIPCQIIPKPLVTPGASVPAFLREMGNRVAAPTRSGLSLSSVAGKSHFSQRAREVGTGAEHSQASSCSLLSFRSSGPRRSKWRWQSAEILPRESSAPPRTPLRQDDKDVGGGGGRAGRPLDSRRDAGATLDSGHGSSRALPEPFLIRTAGTRIYLNAFTAAVSSSFTSKTV
jgi:hypothetical protein